MVHVLFELNVQALFCAHRWTPDLEGTEATMFVQVEKKSFMQNAILHSVTSPP